MSQTPGEQHTRILMKARSLMHACLLLGMNPHHQETIIALKLLALTLEMNTSELDGLLETDPQGTKMAQHIDFFLADTKVGGR